MYRRVAVVLVVAGIALSLGVALVRHDASPSVKHAASGLGPVNDVNGNWSPDKNPFFYGGKETTESRAISQVTTTIYTPSVPLASDNGVIHAWMASVAPTEGMLPTFEQTSVALSYQSGVQVMWVPWQYGAQAPAFSETQVSGYYQRQASTLPIPGISVDTVRGFQVLVVPNGTNGGPGWVEFELGTANSNAVQVTVTGKLSTTDLDEVAASIIERWQAANPAA